MKKRGRIVLLALVVMAGMVWGAMQYAAFSAQTIYAESVAHLTEVFHQARQTLSNLVSDNWSRMRMWTPYLEGGHSDEEIAAYVEQAREEGKFTDFFFVSRNSEYRTLDGKRGYLDMRAKLMELILDKQPIVVNSVVLAQPEIMVFAIPVEQGTYQGFAYEAIAITFNNSDMVNALKINAFAGQASTFAVLSDGRVIINNASDALQGVHNVLALLEKDPNMTAEQLRSLKEDFQTGSSGAMTFSIDGKQNYLIYESAGFQGWTILGIVPASVVNAGMNRLQGVTMLAVAALAIALALMAMLMLVQRNRFRLRQKDGELLARDELFGQLSSNVNDVFLMLSAGSLSVNYVSPNAERLLGISAEQIRGDVHVIERMVQDEKLPFVLDQLADLHPGQQKEWDREYMHQQTAELRWFHVSAFCCEVQGENQYILDMSDRTADRRINLALQEIANAAENASRAKSVFLSTMSHDIRTPLNAVMGFTSLARSNLNDPARAEDYLDKTQAAGRQLLSLINDVLDISRIESGKTTLNLAQESVSGMLRELETLIRPQCNAKRQRLEVTLRDISHDSVMVDKIRFYQICTNLLSNAVKYTQEGGSIRFSIAERPHPGERAVYEITVADNGYGMSREFQQTIFSSFSREEDSRTSKIQGTGLGMAITKNLVDLMGGSIAVESAKGEGSVFTVELPLTVCSPSGAEAAGQAPAQEGPQQEQKRILRGMHILAAEDNELNAEILSEMLQLAGAACELCANGRETVEAFQRSASQQYDLILMDIQMPEMDGYAATRAIRQCAHPQAGSIPIIAMTANAFAEDVQNAIRAGMNGHVAKPLDMAVLEKTVEACLESGPEDAPRTRAT